jgi:hypothetical protein
LKIADREARTFAEPVPAQHAPDYIPSRRARIRRSADLAARSGIISDDVRRRSEKENSIRPLAAIVVALLAAAWIPFFPFPAATAAEIVAAPTGVTIPKGYRNWQVVAPSQRDDKNEIRVILGNNIAMRALRARQLPFPDGAILAKLAWKRVASTEFDNTFVPGEPQRIEFMEKNAEKYAATGGWGFGRFVNGAPADEKEHGTCWPCHEGSVKGNDFVFTRYAR